MLKNKVLSILIALLLISSSISSTNMFIDAKTPVPKRERIVISMGDSYSSGEGVEPFYGQEKPLQEKVGNNDWLAHRSSFAWGGQLTLKGVNGEMSRFKDENWFFVAASGAETKHIIKNKQKKTYKQNNAKPESKDIYLPKQIDIFENERIKGKKVDYVTLTIGGNDVGRLSENDSSDDYGFANIVKEVFLGSASIWSFNPNGLARRLERAKLSVADGGFVADEIEETYRTISEKTNNDATIIVAGYPHLYASSGKGIEVSKDEAKMVNSATDYFNKRISQIVKKCQEDNIKIEFVSVKEAFDGHEAYTSDPYINGFIPLHKEEDLEDDALYSAYSMHPNNMGVQMYAECVQATIDKLEEKVNMEEIETIGEDSEPIDTKADFDSGGRRLYTYVVSDGTSGYGYSGGNIDHDIANGNYWDLEVPPMGNIRHPEYRFLYPGVGYMMSGSDYLYDLAFEIPHTTKTINYQDGYDKYFFDSDTGNINKVETYVTGDGEDVLSTSATYNIDLANRKIIETKSDARYYGGAVSPSEYITLQNTFYYSEGGELLAISGDQYDNQYDYVELGDYVNGDFYEFRVSGYRYRGNNNEYYEGTITYDDSYSMYPRNGWAYVEGTGLPYNVTRAELYFENDLCKSINLIFPSGDTQSINYQYERVKMYGDSGNDASNNTSSTDGSGVMTQDQAYNAVVNYCKTENPNLQATIDEGYYVYWSINDLEDDTYCVTFRSYTGAFQYFYVNIYTGDVKISERVPGIIDEETMTAETFNAWDYVP